MDNGMFFDGNTGAMENVVFFDGKTGAIKYCEAGLKVADHPEYDRLAVQSIAGIYSHTHKVDLINRQVVVLIGDDLEEANSAAEAVAVQIEIRNALAASDKTQLPDFPITSEERQAWRVYRQALRDLEGNPAEIRAAWPKTPG